jgi:TldD protein
MRLEFSPTERAESILKNLKPKVDYLEIRLEDREGESISLYEKGIQNISRAHKIGGCVRACHRGGWGFTSFASMDLLEKMANSAVEIAKSIGQGTTDLAPVSPVQDRIELCLKRDPRKIMLAEKLAIFQEYRAIMLASHSEVISSIGLQYNETFLKKTFLNSEGSHLYQDSMDLGLTWSAKAVAKGEQTRMFDLTGSTQDFNFCLNLESRIRDVCDQVVEYRDAPSLKGGKYTVVLDPLLAGVFAHESFGHTSEADIFADRPGGLEALQLGKRFGSPKLNIYDTGLNSGIAGDLKYDDEGVRTEHTDLIKAGILVGRLHNRETAARLGEKPTGNARALNYHYPPIVRMRSTCIGAGDQSLEDLFEGISEGVYAIGCYGGSGGEQFSFSAMRGIMIRNGTLAEPVKNISLMGNLFETLEQIEGIGGKEEAKMQFGMCGKAAQFPLPVSMESPPIRIRDLTLGGRE